MAISYHERLKLSILFRCVVSPHYYYLTIITTDLVPVCSLASEDIT